PCRALCPFPTRRSSDLASQPGASVESGRGDPAGTAQRVGGIMKQPRTLRRGDGFVEERTRANGSTRWVARWFDGKQWRGKTFPTYDDAEDHVRAVGRAKRAGRFVPDDDFAVTDMLADYLRRGEDRWTSTTLGLYRSSVDNIIVPRIGRWKV